MCVVTVAGRKLSVEDIIPAEEMFSELLKESSEFVNGSGEPFASVGEFIRTRVLCSTLWNMQRSKILRAHKFYILNWCRCSRERRRSGKTSTNLLNPCCCVWSVCCLNWSVALTGPTAWMRLAWGPMDSTKVSLVWTVHFQGLYKNKH